MRSLFIAIAFAGICSCAGAPYFDLRHPVYMVTEQSFWSGCEKDPAGSRVCRASRLKKVGDGANQWFKSFNKATRPKVVVVSSQEKLPSNLVNEVIHLSIKTGFCSKGSAACYAYGWDSSFSGPEIVFESPPLIRPDLVAHELGHALGLDHIPDADSVMFFQPSNAVMPSDIKAMCKLHKECRLLKLK